MVYQWSALLKKTILSTWLVCGNKSAPKHLIGTNGGAFLFFSAE